MIKINPDKSTVLSQPSTSSTDPMAKIIKDYTDDLIDITERIQERRERRERLRKVKSDNEALFKRVDRQLENIKREADEYQRKQLEKKLKKEQLDKAQRQHIESNEFLMRESGMLWTSSLTSESQQIIMQKSPEILSDYKEEQEQKKPDDEQGE